MTDSKTPNESKDDLAWKWICRYASMRVQRVPERRDFEEINDIWDAIIVPAAEHKLLTALAYWQTELCAIGVSASMVHRLLWDIRHSNMKTIEVHAEHLVEVMGALAARGIKAIATKGATFHSYVYPFGERFAGSDVDLMIDPKDRDGAKETLHELGFLEGFFDRSTGMIDLPRREKLKFSVSPDHLPPHCRPTNSLPVSVVYVDVAFSLTWEGAPYSVPVAEALANGRRVSIGHCVYEGLAPPYDFLFAALHLFREARKLGAGRHLDWMKLMDVCLLAKKCIELGSSELLCELVKRHTLQEPISWVVASCDSVFGTCYLQSIVPGVSTDNSSEQLCERTLAHLRARRLDCSSI